MNKEIGQRIRQRRKNLHITQTQIQQQTNISSGNLSGIENGRYLPSAVALIELSKILNCSIDWMLTGVCFSPEPPISFDIRDSGDDAILLNYFHNMTQDDREELLMIAQMKYNKKKRLSTDETGRSL